MKSDSWRSGTQSIDRAIGVLQLIADAPEEGIAAIDLANKTGLTRATAYRLLQALEAHGLVARRDKHRYRLGRGLLSLAATAFDHDPLHAVAQYHLHEVAQVTGESVSVLVRHGYDAVCLARAEGAFSIRMLFRGVGHRLALGIGPGSLVLLSYLSDEERERAIAFNRARLLGTYYPDELSLLESIEEVRRNGYAVDDGLIFKEVFGLAVPVTDAAGVVIGALGTAAVIERINASRKERLLSTLQSAAKTIGRKSNPLTRHAVQSIGAP